MEKDLRKALPHCPHDLALIAESVRLFVIAELLACPLTKAFFFQRVTLFYGLLFYLIWRIRTATQKELPTEEVTCSPTLLPASAMPVRISNGTAHTGSTFCDPKPRRSVVEMQSRLSAAWNGYGCRP